MEALIAPLLDPLRSHLAETDLREWWLLMCTPVFVLAVAAEAWALRQRRVHDWRDSLASLNLGGVYTVLDMVILIGLVLPALQWLHTFRVATVEVTAWTFPLLYLGVELCYYAFHRASHRIRWFWCAHVVHHGSEHMNFTTAMRQSWFYSFAGNWLFYAPMVLLGFDPRWVMFALALNLAYQFFIHTQWVGKLPAPIEWVFNTPSHHRAHHGRNPRYIDRNYGGTLIVFDRLFGTFVDETESVDYGLVHPVHSHNPVWLTVHEWVAMAHDVARPGPWSQRLKHLWAPPEWERPSDNPVHASERPPRPHGTARP